MFIHSPEKEGLKCLRCAVDPSKQTVDGGSLAADTLKTNAGASPSLQTANSGHSLTFTGVSSHRCGDQPDAFLKASCMWVYRTNALALRSRRIWKTSQEIGQRRQTGTSSSMYPGAHVLARTQARVHMVFTCSQPSSTSPGASLP